MINSRTAHPADPVMAGEQGRSVRWSELKALEMLTTHPVGSEVYGVDISWVTGEVTGTNCP